MALPAINRMSERQREKRMVHIGTPVEAGHRMAVGAVGGIPGLLVVGICRGGIIRLVAVIAFDTQGAEAEQRGGGIDVTIVAIGSDMRPDKRKTAPLVDLGNIAHDP